MIKEPLRVGRIVRSRAGRDEGRLFLVIREIDESYVLIADGDLRTVGKPKKKKRKHLEGTGEIRSSLRARLEDGDVIEDHEIRKALAADEPKEEC